MLQTLVPIRPHFIQTFLSNVGHRTYKTLMCKLPFALNKPRIYISCYLGSWSMLQPWKDSYISVPSFHDQWKTLLQLEFCYFYYIIHSHFSLYNITWNMYITPSNHTSMPNPYPVIIKFRLSITHIFHQNHAF